MRPADAIQVRADEVESGDVLWVDDEEVGTCLSPNLGQHPLLIYVSVGDEPTLCIYRGRWERVWVVRRPELFEVTVHLTEQQIRIMATRTSEGFVAEVREFGRACAEWVAAHPEGS